MESGLLHFITTENCKARETRSTFVRKNRPSMQDSGRNRRRTGHVAVVPAGTLRAKTLLIFLTCQLFELPRPRYAAPRNPLHGLLQPMRCVGIHRSRASLSPRK